MTGYDISAMHEAVSRGILIGCPFGGACILVKNEHDLHTTQLLCTERSVVISIGKIGFNNVYLPYSSVSSPSSEIIIEETLAQITNVIYNRIHTYSLF